MIRKIAIDELKLGMYVVDLHKPWLEHNFWRTRFAIADAIQVRRLAEQGITEVSIDTARGIDIPLRRSPPPQPVEPSIPPAAEEPDIAHAAAVSLDEERQRARRLLREANAGLQAALDAACAGRFVDTGNLEPVAGAMIDSVLRNSDALVPLACLKQRGDYATGHAVASAALVIALAHRRGLPRDEIEKLALGTLVKDVGQAGLDAGISSKSGGLSSAERSLVRRHVEQGLTVLEATRRLPETSVAVILEHHERFNGSGYPYNMAGEDISLAGRMAAIADCYDAMVSDRPYRQALPSTVALRQIYHQGGSLFDPSLVASFVRTVGIYPVGSLVRLESGHLAVVEEVHHDKLLQPVVRVVYHAGRRQFVTPVQVDLSRRYGNHYGQIVQAENYAAWGFNPRSWQAA